MSLLNMMKDKYLLTIEDGKILIEPDEYGFTTYPLKDKATAMRVTEEEYYGLMMQEYYIDLNTKKVLPVDEIMLDTDELYVGV